MVDQIAAPFGSWKSPISSDLIAAETIGAGAITPAGEDVYWIEIRPTEAGRYVLVKRSQDGLVADVTPPPFNVRTRVHEYGGGAFTILGGTVYFSNFSDQRLYRQIPGSEPQAISPEEAYRYADFTFDSRLNRLICVREDHTQTGQEAENTIVGVSLEGEFPGEGGTILVSGNNFYSNPRISPDGSHLSWLTWNHPNMPWDGTEVWVGELNANGSISNHQKVAGGIDESIFQPEWSPDGILYFVSDRTGWWNLHRWLDGQVEAVYPMEAEFAFPQWVFGSSAFGFPSKDWVICIYTQNCTSFLARINLAERTLQRIETPYTSLWGLRVNGEYVYFVAASPTQEAALIQLNLSTGSLEILKRTSSLTIDPGYLSLPETIEFPTEDGKTAFGNYYAPQNQDFIGPAGEKPPLLVMSHGGPTGASDTSLNLEVQYWTSRGIAVLDVNYGGSTGYGRAYRLRLNGQWGVVDVDDCVNGALYLVNHGTVDEQRLAITGGSAGGYTTLCALTFRNTFKAGASHFGIGDLETFVKDTHKFESRYLDRLVGSYPEFKAVYQARSPIQYIDQLSTPMILLQGLDDKIVPPNQAEMMFAAVKAKGIPVAYLPFEGEQHGFRQAKNIKRALDAELYFYSRIFGFELADPVEPVKIINLE
jgi:dipeptidyl aminopeptidase/acylaminoacyl peptidase